MRALALDLGGRRIGVAVSDPAGVVVTPVEVLQRSGDRRTDHRRVADLVTEWDADVVVVGLPISLDGSTGPAAQAVLDEVAELRRVCQVDVETVDERLSTVEAERRLREAGVDSRAGRQRVDMVAAAIILESWLERRPTDGHGPAGTGQR